jgi:hypothetical protein
VSEIAVQGEIVVTVNQMCTDLTGQFLPEGSRADELEVFLCDLGNASQEDPHKTKYGGWLTVEYNRDDSRVMKIYAAEHISELQIRNLQTQAVEALATNHGTEVRRKFLHCVCSVEGYFRYRDAFQIIPAPLRRGSGMARPNSRAVSIHWRITVSALTSASWDVAPSAAQSANSSTSAIYDRSSLLKYKMIS